MNEMKEIKIKKLNKLKESKATWNRMNLTERNEKKNNNFKKIRKT